MMFEDQMVHRDGCGKLAAFGAACRALCGFVSVLSPDKSLRGHFYGSAACLSALFHAERYEELVELLAHESFWPFRRWAVRALAAMGRRAEALRELEACRGPWSSDLEIDRDGEEILLTSGFVEEAYKRFGLTANRAGTYLAWFRAVTKKYPQKPAAEVLKDLVEITPGEEGKWFAAARTAGLLDEALALAERSPTDPRTLTRAARDLATKNPAFAVEAGLLALDGLSLGYGYEVTGADVMDAYRFTIEAAERTGSLAATRERMEQILAPDNPHVRFVKRVLKSQLGSL